MHFGTHICSEDEDAEKIVSRHIKLLHRYNEAKDAAQVCIYSLRSTMLPSRNTDE